MSKVEKIAWAKVKINGRDYWQVLIIGSKVIPREVAKIKQEYGTDHIIAAKEQKLLLSGQPEVILIANGWSGVLKVSQDFRKKVETAGAELKVVLTPKVVGEYNRLIQTGKRVNTLIHTTC